MKKEELFTDEFLKQFKTGDELSNFLKEQIQKRGIEKMLEGEVGRTSGLWKSTKSPKEVTPVTVMPPKKVSAPPSGSPTYRSQGTGTPPSTR